MHCRKCGTEFNGGECPSCGTIIEGMMKCTSCYAIIPDNSVACPRCGHMSSEHFGQKDSTKMHLKAYELWSIVSGAISLAISVLVFIDASGMLYHGDVGAFVGFVYVLTSILLLLGGVVSIIRHHLGARTSFFAISVYGVCSFICLLQMFCGFVVGVPIVAWWSLICCVVAVVSAMRK